MGISTKPYKGTRDFYPEDMRLRNWLLGHMRQVVASYGYEPYDGPLLESFELYAAKTGEEIVNEQLYSFEDRGHRKVAIRPEMTPTLARMVADRLPTLSRPIRWFSFPNLWRYERPQKGRLREHWQLNVDILGVNSLDAELETLSVAIDLLQSLGASQQDFEIQINNRRLTNHLFEEVLHLTANQQNLAAKAIDKRAKIPPELFDDMLRQAECSPEQITLLHRFLESSGPMEVAGLEAVEKQVGPNPGLDELKDLAYLLGELELSSYCLFAPTIMRGMDYYTGTVFEIYDRSPDNRRALFGGGRYDNLVAMFGAQPLSGVGFGLGDVTLADFLATHGLMPQLATETQIYVALFSEEVKASAYRLARQLRAGGWQVECALQAGKLGKQYSYADKKGIPLVVLQGPDELAARQVQIKDLRTSQQQTVQTEELAQRVSQLLS